MLKKKSLRRSDRSPLHRPIACNCRRLDRSLRPKYPAATISLSSGQGRYFESAHSSCSICITARRTSSPIMSAKAIAACRHWIRKMQARYLAEDYAAAADSSSKAQPLLGISPSHWDHLAKDARDEIGVAPGPRVDRTSPRCGCGSESAGFAHPSSTHRPFRDPMRRW
jgi:hypothetical protein